MGIRRTVELVRRRINRRGLKITGLVGAGLLPCPDCGGPLIAHLWPIALVAAVRELFQRKNAALRKERTPETWRDIHH
jgi:hypothetical protein